MDVIYWLIPLSIMVLIIAVAILFWAVKNGQFKDLDSPAVDILFEPDDPHSIQLINKSTNKQPKDSINENTDH